MDSWGARAAFAATVTMATFLTWWTVDGRLPRAWLPWCVALLVLLLLAAVAIEVIVRRRKA